MKEKLLAKSTPYVFILVFILLSMIVLIFAGNNSKIFGFLFLFIFSIIIIHKRKIFNMIEFYEHYIKIGNKKYLSDDININFTKLFSFLFVNIIIDEKNIISSVLIINKKYIDIFYTNYKNNKSLNIRG